MHLYLESLIRSFPVRPSLLTHLIPQNRRGGPCPGVTQVVESEGKKFNLFPNWYECHPLKRGEWAWYRYSFTKDPVPRRITAVPEDTFKVKKDAEHKNWNLEVNDELAMSSDKKVIAFGVTLHDPPLSLYEVKGLGTLKAREAIVFSDPNAGNLDSGMFGLTNADDFLGKVELIEAVEHK